MTDLTKKDTKTDTFAFTNTKKGGGLKRNTSSLIKDLIKLLKSLTLISKGQKNLKVYQSFTIKKEETATEKKLSYDLVRFGIKPEIDLGSPLKDIVKTLRKIKKNQEWIDEDGNLRCTKLRIITKKKIKEIIEEYAEGKPIYKLAKENKLS